MRDCLWTIGYKKDYKAKHGERRGESAERREKGKVRNRFQGCRIVVRDRYPR
jgi:hypothetical protein